MSNLPQPRPPRPPATLDNVAAELWQIRQIMTHDANAKAKAGMLYMSFGAPLLLVGVGGSVLGQLAAEQGNGFSAATAISLVMIGLTGLHLIVVGGGLQFSRPE